MAELSVSIQLILYYNLDTYHLVGKQIVSDPLIRKVDITVC